MWDDAMRVQLEHDLGLDRPMVLINRFFVVSLLAAYDEALEELKIARALVQGRDAVRQQLQDAAVLAWMPED